MLPFLKPSTARPTALRKVGAIGDSITADAFFTSSSLVYWSSQGYLAWVRLLLNDRIDLPGSRVWATTGYKIADVAATHLPSALAANLDICIVHCGTNSNDGVVGNTATYIAQLTAIYDALIANGTFVIAIPIRITSAPSAKTGDVLLQFNAINKAIGDYARTKPGILVIDVNPNYYDFSTGNAQAAYLRDGTHDNAVSAKVMGTLVANAISGLIPAWDDRFAQLGDVYDATKNIHGNLLANGLMAGTAGSAFNGATGNVATSWSVFRNANSGTLTVAASKVAHATLNNLFWQRMTFGGTADSNNTRLLQSVNIGANLAIGDTVVAEAEVAWNFTAANIFGIDLRCSAETAGFAELITSNDMGPATSAWPAGTGSVVMRTDPIVIPATTDHVNVALQFNTPASGTPTATVDLLRASLRKV